jgi:hypothetical protein
MRYAAYKACSSKCAPALARRRADNIHQIIVDLSTVKDSDMFSHLSPAGSVSYSTCWLSTLPTELLDSILGNLDENSLLALRQSSQKSFRMITLTKAQLVKARQKRYYAAFVAQYISRGTMFCTDCA